MPLRTCVGCRHVRRSADLLRVAVVRLRCHREGTLQVGRTLPGRGAWLCRGSAACLSEAIRRNAFSRALRSRVTDEAMAELRTQVASPSRAARG